MLDQDRLANSVRTRRGSKSLQEAAEESGVPTSTLSRIENSDLRPSLQTFAKLCDWMDMPMDYFREDGEEPEAVSA